jgi:hypothetical protein
MQHDVREARQAVQEVVDTDKLLRGICLTESAARESALAHDEEPHSPVADAEGRGQIRQAGIPGGRADGSESVPSGITPHMRLAAGLLEPYERQIHSVEGALKVSALMIKFPPGCPIHLFL